MGMANLRAGLTRAQPGAPGPQEPGQLGAAVRMSLILAPPRRRVGGTAIPRHERSLLAWLGGY
jgi:hypothetical protein